MLEKAVACRSDDEVRASDVFSHLAAIQRRIRSHLPKLMKHLWVVEVYCEGAGSAGTQLTRSGARRPRRSSSGRQQSTRVYGPMAPVIAVLSPLLPRLRADAGSLPCF